MGWIGYIPPIEFTDWCKRKGADCKCGRLPVGMILEIRPMDRYSQVYRDDILLIGDVSNTGSGRYDTEPRGSNGPFYMQQDLHPDTDHSEIWQTYVLSENADFVESIPAARPRTDPRGGQLEDVATEDPFSAQA
jgi:hypothetical protein